MTQADSDRAEVRLFGLPSLLLAAVASTGLVYIVLKLAAMVWPLARWMGLVPFE